MRKDKEKATELRKQGLSYRQIRARLKIPLGTISDWFGKIDWSADIAKRLAKESQVIHSMRMTDLNKVRGAHLKRAYESARREAAEDLNVLKYNPLFIAGVMLYWGEGGKNPKDGVKFVNTDAQMITFYVDFLVRACRIPMDRIKAHILIYPDLQENICRSYWSKVSGIPIGNFTKSTLIQGRHKTRRLNWGICTVTVSSYYFKQKILEWIKLLPQELMNEAYYANM
ncbi:MAG: hypothetical protein PHD04_02400 [Candidatus Pacebacteria bacterium]|nr:hypothetical protein [Candidatus Paceibacterota bacterium]